MPETSTTETPPATKTAEQAGKTHEITINFDTPEMQERIKAEVDKNRDQIRSQVVAEIEAEQKAAKDAADLERKKKEGDLQGLLDAEKAAKAGVETENATLKLQIKRAEVKDAIRDYIAESHKEYGTSVAYILPMVEFDAKTEPGDISRRVKSAVDKFVKDNPRAISAGAPLPSSRMKSTGGAGDGTSQTNGHTNRISEYTKNQF